MRRAGSMLLVGLVGITFLAWPVHAVGPIVIVLHWTDTDFSEGLAFSGRGDLYVGFGLTGDIVKISRAGEVSLFANIDPTDQSLTLGLAVDPRSNVFVAVWSSVDSTNGVWKISPTGQAARFAAMPLGTIPNAIVFDERGNLLVTDSAGGAVWFVPRSGGSASLWVADPLLAPSAAFGANGIARRGNEVVVLNWDMGRIVKIPILPDGSAGTPSLFLEDPQLLTADGIAFDVRGNMYVGVNDPSQLLRVSPDGAIETLVLFPDNLDFATNVAFGDVDEPTTAYLTIGGFGQDTVVKVDIGIPGLPVR